jgi:competence protein ComEC
MILISVSVAWVLGTLVGTRLGLPAWTMALALLPLPLLFFRRRTRLTIASSICLLALLGGALRAHTNIAAPGPGDIRFYNDGPASTVTGVVATAPDVRDKTTHLTISVREIDAGAGPVTVSGRVMAYVPPYPEFAYGDVVRVTGELQTPPVLDDFDYAGYLAGRDIFSVMTYPRVEVTSRGAGFAPLSWVYSARQALSARLAEVLPEPQAALAQGIILGIRAGIPQSVNDDFARTGTTHVLAISGMNLNIVAGLFVATFVWIFGRRRYTYVWLALSSTWVYALLTGLNAPVVRAAIMLSVFFLADVFGRQRSALPALALAAAVMTAVSPRLLGDASFQLSFLATFAMAVVAPPIQSWARDRVAARLGDSGSRVRTVNWLTDSLTLTLSVVLIVWPVTAHYFGLFSIVAPVATLLIAWALAPVTIAGGLAAVLSLVFLPLGQAIGWVAWLFLSYMLAVIHWLGSLPAAAVNSDSVSPLAVFGYLAAVVLALWLFRSRQWLRTPLSRAFDWLGSPARRWTVPCLLVLSLLSTAFAINTPDDRLHVSFLNVGQGDAILIQRGSEDILVDGGPTASAVIAGLSSRMPFYDRTIELVVATHPDADHLTGLLEVLRRYRVQHVVYLPSDSTSALWQQWLDLVEAEHAEVTYAVDGQRIDAGGVEIAVELPLEPGKHPTTNTSSIVLRVSDGRISFLLTADIPEETELQLASQRAPLASTVLKVAHHGSGTSSSEQFLATVSPQIAVVSVGADNDYGHPTKEALARLTAQVGEANIYRTDLNGTIEFITDGERLWLKEDRPGK